MNIKLHTPKSLKAGSGMGSAKQFLLSLLATTVSIALTFGTAALVDNNKKRKEKREIVMMVMYDMYNSLEIIQHNDTRIRRMMDFQLEIAKDTTLFATKWVEFAMLLPEVDYTETTERIFSSNIETINTVGNMLFTENVANFYQARKQYKAMACDSIYNKVTTTPVFETLNGWLDYSLQSYAVLSVALLRNMQTLYAQCKQMMDISDEELEAYLNERKQWDQGMASDRKEIMQKMDEIKTLQNSIDIAKKRLKSK